MARFYRCGIVCITASLKIIHCMHSTSRCWRQLQYLKRNGQVVVGCLYTACKRRSFVGQYLQAQYAILPNKELMVVLWSSKTLGMYLPQRVACVRVKVSLVDQLLWTFLLSWISCASSFMTIDCFHLILVSCILRRLVVLDCCWLLMELQGLGRWVSTVIVRIAYHFSFL